MRIIERIGGYYEPEEVPFGVVYGWQPAFLLIECECGEMLNLSCSMASCNECGADHTALVREELAEQCSKEEALRPWRYAQKCEGRGLPC